MKNLLPLWPSLDGEFIVSETNLMAYDAVLSERWPNNIIIVYGSWGKSHLAKMLMGRGYQICAPHQQPIHPRIIWDNFPTDYNDERAFHNWNQILEKEYMLCVTMRLAPQRCTILPYDLKSRMAAAYSVKVRPPNHELRQKIFMQWLKNGGVEIHVTALEYFFQQYDGNLQELSEYARKLHTFALLNQRKLTVHSIKVALEGSTDCRNDL